MRYFRTKVCLAAAISCFGGQWAQACDWYDVVCEIRKEVVDPIQEKAKEAARTATNVVNNAAHGDFDAVANDIIAQAGDVLPFRDALLGKINEVAPSQVAGFVQRATDIAREVDSQSNQLRAQTYKNLYNTYKSDALAVFKRLQDGNFDFREYFRYSLWYSVATADWSNPDAMKASAMRIALDQYAAYSWYSAHTVKGAAIGTVRGKVGLTDAAIVQGVKDLSDEEKRNSGAGALSALVITEFMRIAKETQVASRGGSMPLLLRITTSRCDRDYSNFCDAKLAPITTTYSYADPIYTDENGWLLLDHGLEPGFGANIYLDFANKNTSCSAHVGPDIASGATLNLPCSLEIKFPCPAKGTYSYGQLLEGGWRIWIQGAQSAVGEFYPDDSERGFRDETELSCTSRKGSLMTATKTIRGSWRCTGGGVFYRSTYHTPAPVRCTKM